MPLLNTVSIAGRNQSTVVDVFVADSAVTTLTAAAGGDVDTNADYREQVIPVIADTTTIVPVGEGVAQTTSDETVTTPKYQVQKWPTWRSVTEEYADTKDPVDLAMEGVNAVAPRFPISFDEWYLNLIVAGASATEEVFNPAGGVASLKAVLAEFTATSYAADGFCMTRRGTNELGWNVDADLHRMDLTQSTGINTAETGGVLALLGLNTVLGVIGPWGQSKMSISQGLDMQEMRQSTVNGKGPANGYVNHRAQMAMGWGNAQATNENLTTSGAGFVILTIAP